jgi:hypothetical protein
MATETAPQRKSRPHGGDVLASAGAWPRSRILPRGLRPLGGPVSGFLWLSSGRIEDSARTQLQTSLFRSVANPSHPADSPYAPPAEGRGARAGRDPLLNQPSLHVLFPGETPPPTPPPPRKIVLVASGSPALRGKHKRTKVERPLNPNIRRVGSCFCSGVFLMPMR